MLIFAIAGAGSAPLEVGVSAASAAPAAPAAPAYSLLSAESKHIAGGNCTDTKSTINILSSR